jgi:hemerythrin
MAIALWHDRYCTGIQIIDDQHRQLLDAINELHDAFQAGRPREEMTHLLDFLVSYTVSHFQTEESYMAENGYPDLAKHRDYHQVLIGRVLELKQRFLGPTPPSSVELARFMGEWLSHHINEVDMGYANYVRSHS